MRLASCSVVLVLGSVLGAHAQQPDLVRDVNSTVDVASLTNPSDLTAGTNGLYFATYRGVWRTDGTPAGTTMTRDLLANGVLEVTASGPLVYFVAQGSLWRDAPAAEADRQRYGCGCFWFQRREEAILTR